MGWALGFRGEEGGAQYRKLDSQKMAFFPSVETPGSGLPWGGGASCLWRLQTHPDGRPGPQDTSLQGASHPKPGAPVWDTPGEKWGLAPWISDGNVPETWWVWGLCTLEKGGVQTDFILFRFIFIYLLLL